MTACETFTRTFKVGLYHVTLTVPLVAGVAIGMEYEWFPDMPRRLSKKHLAEYVIKRDAALVALATQLGGSIAVVSPGLESGVKIIEPERQP